ncbi:MAG: hypothetical protein M3271_03935, partial [Actinomycetota bacterium]|nr:hypothetical protein [Actinomycetota bacterium]
MDRATFEFSSTEAGSTFECSLNGAVFGSCSSPKTYTGLAEGSHAFEVRATDPAGNVDSTPAQRTWVVDIRQPETELISGPSGITTTNQATFTFSSSESPGTFECSLDGGAFNMCSSPKTYRDLLDGSHTFKVRATDAGGSFDETPVERTWVVDAFGPYMSLQRPTGGVCVNNTCAGSSLVPPVVVGYA